MRSCGGAGGERTDVVLRPCGSAVVVRALTCALMEDAVAEGTAVDVMGGVLVGAASDGAADVALERMLAEWPRRTGRDPGDAETGAARGPETSEQAAIGVGLGAEGQGLGLVLLGAVSLGNVPESTSRAVGMREEGRSRTDVLGVWGAVAVVCTLATVLGDAVLGDLSARWVGALLALAAGAILAMRADTMMPEAFKHGGPLVAMATAVGF